MKSKEAAAKEQINWSISNEPVEQSFLAGIKFAETWISVDDELPENEEIVMVKYSDDAIYILYHIDNIWYGGYMFRNEEFEKPSFWRPINRK